MLFKLEPPLCIQAMEFLLIATWISAVLTSPKIENCSLVDRSEKTEFPPAKSAASAERFWSLISYRVLNLATSVTLSMKREEMRERTSTFQL
jgi:hypothetical protein